MRIIAAVGGDLGWTQHVTLDLEHLMEWLNSKDEFDALASIEKVVRQCT
jgi:hypothetical protein